MIGYKLLIILTILIIAIKVIRYFFGREIPYKSNLEFLDLNWFELEKESYREMLRLNEITQDACQ